MRQVSLGQLLPPKSCWCFMTGLEPTNFYKVFVHPVSPNLIYAGAADIKGVVSEDGGQSWRILDPFKQAARNSIYGFAFDPNQPRRVFVATAKWHDYPHEWYASPLNVSFVWQQPNNSSTNLCDGDVSLDALSGPWTAKPAKRRPAELSPGVYLYCDCY